MNPGRGLLLNHEEFLTVGSNIVLRSRKGGVGEVSFEELSWPSHMKRGFHFNGNCHHFFAVTVEEFPTTSRPHRLTTALARYLHLGTGPGKWSHVYFPRSSFPRQIGEEATVGRENSGALSERRLEERLRISLAVVT